MTPAAASRSAGRRAGSRRRGVLLAYLLVTVAGARGERVVYRFDVERTRDFGYLIGDVIETRVHLEIEASGSFARAGTGGR